MPQRMVYGVSLWVFLGAAACTIAAVVLPNWISYTAPTDNDPIRVTYGLSQRCSSITGLCTPFPQEDECKGDGLYFCSMWKSAGFFMNFSMIFDLACLIAYITVFLGGRNAREAGWKMLSGLLCVVGVTQLISMAMVAHLYENDTRFFVGWELDKSWILCTVSWAVTLINAAGIAMAAYVSPREDDYEPIPEPN